MIKFSLMQFDIDNMW